MVEVFYFLYIDYAMDSKKGLHFTPTNLKIKKKHTFNIST